MSDSEENAKITVTVKTPKEKKTVEVQENATISEVSVFIHYTCICSSDYDVLGTCLKCFRHAFE